MEVTQIVGLSKQEVSEVMARNGIPYRVVEEDGDGRVVTADHRAERANLKIRDGKVAEIYYG